MIQEKKNKANSEIITINRRIGFKYFVEKKIEAGLMLCGWEVKALRFNNVNISNSYVIIKDNEAFLLGANFAPLIETFTHCSYNPTRTRKLLLKKYEIISLYNYIIRKNYTIVAMSLYWKDIWCKVQIGIAKGKKQYDKRHDLKKSEWQRDKSRIIKMHNYHS